MGNVCRVHTQMNAILARHSPNALHASSCKTDWLRGWCHTGSRDASAVYTHTLALFLFPSATINTNGAYKSAGVPRLVTHRDDDDTVPRDSSRDSGFSSRPRKRSRDAGGGERRNRTRDYTALCAYPRLKSYGERMLSAVRFLFTVTDTGNLMLTYKSEKESSFS